MVRLFLLGMAASCAFLPNFISCDDVFIFDVQLAEPFWCLVFGRSGMYQLDGGGELLYKKYGNLTSGRYLIASDTISFRTRYYELSEEEDGQATDKS